MAKRRRTERLAIEVLRSHDLTYGVVAVVKGKYAGRLGYYDDDADDLHRAIVFLDSAPLGSDYAVIWKKWLRNATRVETRRWTTQHMNELAYHRAAKKLGPR